MPSPSPVCTVSDNGGGAQATTNGVNITPATTTTIALGSTAGVNNWSLTIVGTDELVAAPTVTVNNTNKTATFTAPTAGSALRFQSVVNGGVDINGQTQASYTTTFEVFTLQSGNRVFATNETTEGNAAFGWITKINPVLRAGAGGSTPTGTGIPHIVGGVQNGAASLIVNADVDPAAAIDGSKLNANLAIATSVAAGTTTSTTGDLRISATGALKARNNANSADLNVLSTSADALTIGGTSCNGLVVAVATGQTVYPARVNGADVCFLNSVGLQMGKPIVGSNDGFSNSAYGVHGCATVAGGDAPYTEVVNNYRFANLIYTGALTAGRTYTLPAPASLATSYVKAIFNNTTGGFAITFTTGAGTTVAIAATKTALLHFDSTGVRRLTADV